MNEASEREPGRDVSDELAEREKQEAIRELVGDVASEREPGRDVSDELAYCLLFLAFRVLLVALQVHEAPQVRVTGPNQPHALGCDTHAAAGLGDRHAAV